MPFFAGFNHERCNDGMMRKSFFHLFNFTQIIAQRTICDQFNIVETDHAVVAVVDGSVAGRNIDDRDSKGFPNCTAPPCVEGFHDLVAAIGRWCGCEPEGVWRRDACEIGKKVSHIAER